MGFAELEKTDVETITTTFLRKLDEWVSICQRFGDRDMMEHQT